MWPQYTLIGLVLVNVGLHLGKHGQPRGNFNIFLYAFDGGFLCWLLYMGGFFKGL